MPGGLQNQYPANKYALFQCRATVLCHGARFKQHNMLKYNIQLVFVCKDVTKIFYGIK